GAVYPLTAAATFGAGALVMARFVAIHHPFETFGAANQVTTLRAALIALIVGLVFEPVTRGVAATATAMAVIVSALDGVDGWLARRTQMSSAFGARFDVESDSLFVMTMSVLVWRHDKAGVWILAGGFFRYAFVAAGWILPWMAGRLRPTNRARTVAACHMLGLTIALAPIVPAWFSTAGLAATLTLLAWSFAVDVGRLWRGETT
ncbi:MAG: CDP-alcohol phosphatidyltransferase family protein, partial [Vicinamibacterales bacterium]